MLGRVVRTLACRTSLPASLGSPPHAPNSSKYPQLFFSEAPCRGISKPVQQRGAAHALREVWCPESNGYKSLQAWRRDLKELVPELLRAHGYCRPEIVKKVLLY